MQKPQWQADLIELEASQGGNVITHTPPAERVVEMVVDRRTTLTTQTRTNRNARETTRTGTDNQSELPALKLNGGGLHENLNRFDVMASSVSSRRTRSPLTRESNARNSFQLSERMVPIDSVAVLPSRALRLAVRRPDYPSSGKW